MKCKVCMSPYLDYINSELNKGKSSYEVSRLLKDKHDVDISHDSINDHRKNHLIPLYDTLANPNIFLKLEIMGNHRLVKGIQRAIKILDTYRKCACVNPTEFMKRGRVYLCKFCEGWIRWDYARSIINQRKRERRDMRQKETLSRVVRTSRRFY